MASPDGIARYTPTLSGDIVLKILSLDRTMSPHLADAITQLTKDSNWYVDGDPVADIVAAANVTVNDYYENMLIGSVLPWLITPPSGWLLLDGTTYASSDYPELSALLPTHLISGSNFILPDVSGAFPFGVVDEDDGSQVSGANSITLTVAQLPAHDHVYTPPVLTVEAETPSTPIPTAGIGTPTTTGSTGSGDSVDIRPLRFGLIYAVYAGRA